MEKDVWHCVWMCVHCADSRIDYIILQPSEIIRYGSVLSEVRHAGYLYLGEADGGTVFTEEMCCEYLLVLVGDMSCLV